MRWVAGVVAVLMLAAPEPDALWMQAGDAEAVEALGEAAGAYLELAEEFPLDDRAPEAAERAARLARQAHLERPEDRAAGDLYGRALDLLVERYPRSRDIDFWTFERGRWRAGRGEHEAALRDFASVASGAGVYPEARFHIAASRYRLAEALSGEARREGMERARRAAAEAREMAESTMKRVKGPRWEELRNLAAGARVIESRASLAAGDADGALAALDGMSLDELPGDLVAEALVARVRAREATGDATGLEADLERLADEASKRAAAVVMRLAIEAHRELSQAEASGVAAEELGRRSESRLRTPAELAHRLAGEAEAKASAALILADALRWSGRPAEALPLYEAALERRETLEATFGRAESLFTLRRDEEAMPEFRRLAASLGSDRDWRYWQCELRCLQILDRVDRHTGRIAPYVERLRRLDATLGGPRFAPEFDRLAARHRGEG